MHVHSLEYPSYRGTLSTWSHCHHNGDHHFKTLHVPTYNVQIFRELHYYLEKL